jgi:hypothetical protein
MILLQRKWVKSRVIFHLLAILSALIFGNIAALAIQNILRDDTVFMTNIHGIFLNPFFLISASYLGVYLIYLMTLSCIKEF